jgi:phosphoglycerate dehydrogenase-like enzyme
MPKEYENLLVESFKNQYDFHFVESTTTMRSSLKDAHMVVGMPFSYGAVRKSEVLKKVHLWTAQVPLSWQKAQGIEVSSSSGINSDSVAEHALFMIMKALRGEVGLEEFRHDGSLVAQSPKSLTLGILGLGNRGESLLKLARPLFGKVIACSRTKKSLEGLDEFFELSNKNEFLSQSDYIVICVPLSDGTKELLVGDEFYAALNDNVTLINVARGELIDEAELVNFLKTKKEARYLSDVTYPEPYPDNGALQGLENIFLTPHVAGRRDDIWKLLTNRTIEEIKKLD